MNDMDGDTPNDGQVERVGSEQVDTGQPTGEHTGREEVEMIDAGQAGRVGLMSPEGDGPTPGDVLRTLPSEAQQRGTRYVSAQAMQAKLFSVYDAAAAAEDALALVQQQLTLTLNRNYYEADEIESMAAELDALLMLESLELSEDDLVSED
ncbi:MAG: hypothetical protein ABSC41_07265 [Acidimicrobiales bacterium]|jgi:hypothetical protein